MDADLGLRTAQLVHQIGEQYFFSFGLGYQQVHLHSHHEFLEVRECVSTSFFQDLHEVIVDIFESVFCVERNDLTSFKRADIAKPQSFFKS